LRGDLGEIVAGDQRLCVELLRQSFGNPRHKTAENIQLVVHLLVKHGHVEINIGKQIKPGSQRVVAENLHQLADFVFLRLLLLRRRGGEVNEIHLAAAARFEINLELVKRAALRFPLMFAHLKKSLAVRNILDFKT